MKTCRIIRVIGIQINLKDTVSCVHPEDAAIKVTFQQVYAMAKERIVTMMDHLTKAFKSTESKKALVFTTTATTAPILANSQTTLDTDGVPCSTVMVSPTKESGHRTSFTGRGL